MLHFDMLAKEQMEHYLSLLSVDISDYTFAANYIWLANINAFYSIINDTFCLFLLSDGELSMLLPPLGKREQVYDAMLRCFEIMNENNTMRNYSRIDYVYEPLLEGFVNYLEEGTLIYHSLEEYLIEKGLVDYVYRADDLIDLRGNAYHTKRNEINKFIKAYPDYEIAVLDSQVHGDSIEFLFNKWVSDRVKYMPKGEVARFVSGIYQEQLAIKRMLKHYEQLNLIGIVLFISGELKGFTVGEQVNQDTAAIIIEKTDFEVLGCAQFIFKEFCKILKDKFQSQYINVGDDMGFENLKKVKMSYRPAKLIPKYTIYQR
ncbi:MAG: phosphatidylglycerol lysyltransferase domain-containing protein [Thiotrichaceae bacterium]